MADQGKPDWLNHSSTAPDEARRQLAARLAFLELSERDAERLRTLAEPFLAHAPQFVEAFYKHLFAFDETSRFLADPALVERLKQAQQTHLQSLLAAEWDESYIERRLRVGEVHARVGIEPEFFLGAYNQYLQHWISHFAAQSTAAETDSLDQLGSLIRVVLLDIGLTLDAYFAESTQNIRKALGMYWSANNELRQFAQLASHDLKTPLATVANLCDEALDEFSDQMPPAAAELIEKARQRALRMSTTIDELLASSIADRESEHGEVVSSQQVIAEAVERIAPELARQGIQLAILTPLPPVMADAPRLLEVFANLLSNAAKFIDKRPGRIEIAAERRDAECVFSVADNGPGIRSEELIRIFSPFRRLPEHQHIAGSGLGLYFTRNLVEQLHGRVWAESALGLGSQFYVALPAAPQDPQE